LIAFLISISIKSKFLGLFLIIVTEKKELVNEKSKLAEIEEIKCGQEK